MARNRTQAEQMERELEKFVNTPETAVIQRMRQQTDGGLSAHDYYVKMFRQCWAASDPLHRDTANLTLDGILTEDPRNPQRLEALRVLGKHPLPKDTLRRPVFCVDLTGLGIRANPRDYLDQLALTLITARRRLGVCLAEGCEHPYFIARYPRQHYCSDKCLAVGRRASKRSWARMNYDKKAVSPNEFGTRENARPIAGSRQNRKKSSSRKEKQ